MAEAPVPPLVLASTSPYRRALLERLGLPFAVEAPRVDEGPRPGEAPAALARRLALAKARAVAARRPGALVIGSDQVAELEGRPLGKPGDRPRALAQLLALAGRRVAFHTGLALVGPGAAEQVDLVPYGVRFRPFGRAEAEAYLDREPAYDCAGAFRSEGLGIALVERFEGEDPTALVGLPLIRLCRMLEAAGRPVLA